MLIVYTTNYISSLLLRAMDLEMVEKKIIATRLVLGGLASRLLDTRMVIALREIGKLQCKLQKGAS